MDRIDLTADQVAKVRGYRDRADYPGGYLYVGSIISS